MEKLKGFDFAPLEFDQNGKALGTGIADLAAFAAGNGVTDVILLCHGFRNDAADARNIYGGFLDTLGKNLAKLNFAGRKIAAGGAFWPSMLFSEKQAGGKAASVGSAVALKQLESMKAFLKAPDRKRVDKIIALSAKDDEKSQVEMVRQLLAIVGGLGIESNNEAAAAFKKATPEALQRALSVGAQATVTKPKGGASVGIPTLANASSTSSGSAQSFLGSVFGFLPKFANLSSFLLMFDRCAFIGSAGLAGAARAVRQSAPGVRIHLVGHSLGGRAVTACAQALLKAPKVQVDTMMLLQAAYSHFGLAPAGTSAQGVKHPRGNFRDVVEKKAVKGAILATHSDQDSVVGFAYTSMAQLSGNNAAAFGDAKSPFGGIGRNGVLDTPEVVRLELKTAGTPYGLFDPTRITTLDGGVPDGGKARIQNHGDVTNAHVTWAFASLLSQL